MKRKSERHLEQLVQEIGGLLQVRLAAPASAVVQPARQSDKTGLLSQTVHELTSSRACSGPVASQAVAAVWRSECSGMSRNPASSSAHSCQSCAVLRLGGTGLIRPA